MAWLDRDPSGHFHVCFRVGDRKFKRSLRTTNERSANGSCLRLEENLRLVEAGRLEIPPGTDIAVFLLSDGKLGGKIEIPKTILLGKLFIEYEASLPVDSLEAGTLKVAKIHMRHLERFFGVRFAVQRLCQQELQSYVNHRSRQTGHRGRLLSASTIKKELSTFSTVWSWAMTVGYMQLPFPNQKLRFPKTSEKPPFQTWGQIERQIKLGRLTAVEQADLWDCLFLSVAETDELLRFIESNSQYSFLYPMAVMAAHTGARRSELARCRIGDFDFTAGTVLIHEKKRVKGRRSLRLVPLSPKLTSVIGTWMSARRASPYTFPSEFKCHRERKARSDDDGVSADEASHHLEQTLLKSKWEKVRGWHIFRHSFISNCAARGIDQRMIDRWSGHQTEEMRRRYTHLFPDAQRQAIQLVYG